MSDEDHISGGTTTLILIIFASLMAAWLHAKEHEVDSLLDPIPQPILRESMGPKYIGEMHRKMARLEARARGMAMAHDCKAFRAQPCRIEKEKPVINDMDRSSLSGLIIEGAWE